MASKSKFKQEPFKLQVYVDSETVKKIDLICENQNIYRSGLVTEAIKRLLSLSKYRKILGLE